MKTIRRVLILCCALLILLPIMGRQRWEKIATTTAASLARQSSHGRVHHSVSTTPERPIAIVLGAGIRSPHLRARLETAVALYHAGKVSRLLLSGDGRSASYDEVATMRRELLRQGVPADALIEDRQGLSTWESLQRAKTTHQLSSAIVITQAFHADRCALIAQHFDLDIHVCCAASPADAQRDQSREARARVRALLDILGLRSWTTTCKSQRQVSLGSYALAEW